MILNPVSDKVVEMSKDLEFFGIKAGDSYSVAMDKITSKISGLFKEFPAVEDISTQIENLDSDKILVKSDLTGLSSDSLSSDASKLINRSASILVEEATTGSMVGFDLSNAVSDLPLGYNLLRTNVKISGKKKNGSTSIMNNDLVTAMTNVSNDRYPLDVELLAVVSTPAGQVHLTKNTVIQSPLSGTFGVTMGVKDLSKAGGEELSLTEFINLSAAQIRQNKSNFEGLNNLEILGTENIKFSSLGIKNVVALLVTKLDESLTTIKNLETDVKNLQSSLSSVNSQVVTLGGSTSEIPTCATC